LFDTFIDFVRNGIYHGFAIELSVGTVDMEMFASLERQQKETLPVVHGMYYYYYYYGWGLVRVFYSIVDSVYEKERKRIKCLAAAGGYSIRACWSAHSRSLEDNDIKGTYQVSLKWSGKARGK